MAGIVIICVVGDLADLTAAYIRSRAESCGIEVLALSEAALGVDWAFGYEMCTGQPITDAVLAVLTRSRVSRATARRLTAESPAAACR